MTTTDRDLTEQIAAVLDEAREDLCGFNARDMAADVLPIVKAAQAEAWDQGMAAAAANAFMDWVTPAPISNPYAEKEPTR